MTTSTSFGGVIAFADPARSMLPGRPMAYQGWGTDTPPDISSAAGKSWAKAV